MVEWTKGRSEKRWVKIENIMADTNLGKNIWTPPQHRALGVNTLRLTKNVMRIWDELHKQNK